MGISIEITYRCDGPGCQKSAVVDYPTANAMGIWALRGLRATKDPDGDWVVAGELSFCPGHSELAPDARSE
jgi:hypothetical protein